MIRIQAFDIRRNLLCPRKRRCQLIPGFPRQDRLVVFVELSGAGILSRDQKSDGCLDVVDQLGIRPKVVPFLSPECCILTRAAPPPPVVNEWDDHTYTN